MGIFNFFKKIDDAISLKMFCHFPNPYKISYLRKTKKRENQMILTKDNLNIYHEDVKKHLEEFKNVSLLNSLESQINIEEENKTLIWFQTSMRVLKDALAKCEGDPSLVFQGFVWIEPNLLRFSAFNVDCSLYFLPNQILKIIFFNDKSGEHGSSEKPALEAVIIGQKPAFLNEVIIVLGQIGQLLEKEARRS